MFAASFRPLPLCHMLMPRCRFLIAAFDDATPVAAIRHAADDAVFHACAVARMSPRCRQFAVFCLRFVAIRALAFAL